MSEAQKEAARIAAYGKNECAGSQARAVADYAATFVGILPYVLGGASLTNGADCSGFIGQILAKFGLLDQNVANVHGYNSWGFRSLGTAVQYDDSSLQALVSCLKPGDVICYDGHVALYYGNGVVVHEPLPGRKAEWSGIMMKPILTIRRFASSEPGFVQ